MSKGHKTGKGSRRADPAPPPRRPLLLYLQGILPSLTPAERLTAEFVLADPERILSSSLAEIRNGAGASVGSIVGFCRNLCLKGFAVLTIAPALAMTHGAVAGTPASSAAPARETL